MTAFAATTDALWRRLASGRCHVSASHTDTLPEGHTNTRIQHANYVAERCTPRYYRIIVQNYETDVYSLALHVVGEMA